MVNTLREKNGLLCTRDSMTRFCYQNPEAEFEGNYCAEYGFKVQTPQHTYMLRCKAYAVSYMLCQRYGVDVKGYDISRLDGVLQGQDPREEVPAALTDMRDTFKEMNGRMARAMGLTRASRQKEQER